MRVKLVMFFAVSVVMFSVAVSSFFPAHTFAATCTGNKPFLLLPHWYDGLQVSSSDCNIKITDINQIWTIVANVLDILLRLIGLLAVVFIIIGGVRYVISQGESSGVSAAKQTITRAITGLVIAIVSVVILNFIIGIFGLRTIGNQYQVTSMVTIVENA